MIEYVNQVPGLEVFAGIFVGLFLFIRLYLLVRDIGRLDSAE